VAARTALGQVFCEYLGFLANQSFHQLLHSHYHHHHHNPHRLSSKAGATVQSMASVLVHLDPHNNFILWTKLLQTLIKDFNRFHFYEKQMQKTFLCLEQAVEQLVEVLRYKQKGRVFNFR
jgi:hypothetical protein